MSARQFSLRKLFGFLTLCSLILGSAYYVVEVRPREQTRIVRAISRANGRVSYDFESHQNPWVVRWKAPLATFLGKDTVGVVRDVSLMSVEDPRQLASALGQVSKLGSVETISLQGSNVDEECIKVISRMERLTHIYLSGTRYPLPSLTGLRNLVQLECLSLGFRSGVTDRAAGEIAQMPRLQELDLAYSDVSDGGLRELSKCRDLVWLDVTRTPTTAEGFIALLSAPALRTIYVDRDQEPAVREMLPRLEIVVYWE